MGCKTAISLGSLYTATIMMSSSSCYLSITNLKYFEIAAVCW